MLMFLTLIAGAALAGGVAVGLTTLVVVAAVALVAVGAANGMRTVGRLFDVLRD
jgi:hypothetical protein